MFNIRIIAENITKLVQAQQSAIILHYLLTGLQFEELSNGSRLDKILIIITIFIIRVLAVLASPRLSSQHIIFMDLPQLALCETILLLYDFNIYFGWRSNFIV